MDVSEAVVRSREIGGDPLSGQRVGHVLSFHETLQPAPQLHKGFVVVVHARGLFRKGPADGNPFLRQIDDAPQDRKGHPLAVAPEEEDLVGHAGFRNQLSLLRPDGLQESLRIDIVEVVSFRNRLDINAIKSRQRIVLPVVEQDVSHEPALLQQIAGPRQVVHPGSDHPRPGLMPAEPLPEPSQPGPRNLVIGRLMRGFMEDETVETAFHGDVGNVFQTFRGVGIGVVESPHYREGFCRGNILAEDMGGGRRFPDIGFAHLDRPPHPDGGHRDRRRHLQVHAIPDERAGILMGFRIASPHPVFLDDSVDTVVVLRHQVPDCLPPVPKEFFRLPGTVDDLSRQGRKPAKDVIAVA